MAHGKAVVGFIGLGIMGQPMARNLMKAGFGMVVYTRTRRKAEELLAEGARWAESPAAVARQAPMLITMVPDSPDVEQIVLGPQGVIEGVGPGSVVIDMSTVSPRVERAIAQKLASHEVAYLDAPVSGGSWGAIQGTLAIMVGGEEDAFRRVLPIFEAMGKSITYMGPSGAGQVTKLVNQILVAVTLSGVAEALVFGAKAGADLMKTIEAVKGGAAGSWQLANLGPRIVNGDFAPGFMITLQVKDLRLILEMAQELALPLPLTAAVAQLYRAAAVDGKGECGTQAVVTVLERLAGVQARQGSA
ncbi:MAG TPA: NAD(P)-binding domain-containing protein [Candidatus Methylomirabilis sp.]|nr:NAD(P)-binding domain-containing protein [Candidatus Methylomirabilis sp.]